MSTNIVASSSARMSGPPSTTPVHPMMLAIDAPLELQLQMQQQLLGPYAASPYRDQGRSPRHTSAMSSQSITDETGDGYFNRNNNTAYFRMRYLSSTFGSEDIFPSPRDSLPSSPRLMQPVSTQSTLSRCLLSRKEEHIRMRYTPAHNSFAESSTGSALPPYTGATMPGSMDGSIRESEEVMVSRGSEDAHSPYPLYGATMSPWQSNAGMGLVGCNPFVSRNWEELSDVASPFSDPFIDRPLEGISEETEQAQVDDQAGKTEVVRASFSAFPSAEVSPMTAECSVQYQQLISPDTLRAGEEEESPGRTVVVGPPSISNSTGFTRKYFLRQTPPRTEAAAAPAGTEGRQGRASHRYEATTTTPTIGAHSWPTFNMHEVLDNASADRSRYGTPALRRSGSESFTSGWHHMAPTLHIRFKQNGMMTTTSEALEDGNSRSCSSVLDDSNGD